MGQRLDWTSGLPPSRSPLHFSVFSKSYSPHPLSGFPLASKNHILPFVPFPRHPQENRQGRWRWDSGSGNQLCSTG